MFCPKDGRILKLVDKENINDYHFVCLACNTEYRFHYDNKKITIYELEEVQ